jgi:hypothetical protein
MNVAAFAIGWWLLSQTMQQGDPHKPEVRPRAPAVKLYDTGPDAGAPPETHRPAHEKGTASGNDHGAPPAHTSEPAGDAGGPMTTVEGGPRPKLRPPELLAEALQKPVEGALVGTPLSLEAALARSPDRTHQLKIAQAYWRLCTAQADYHWSLDQRDKLAHYTRTHSNSPATHSARSSIRADVRDAQLAVARSQQDLADLLGSASGSSPPLATDRPHVGEYLTGYETIFGNRAPPPRLRLIHRTLPVLRQAIDEHGEAIVAAIDALESTGEHFEKTGQGLTTILATLDQLKRERRTFMADVRDYNQDIAEYAFATAPPGTDGRALVARLILTKSRSADARPRTAPEEGGPAEAPRYPAAPPRYPAVNPAVDSGDPAAEPAAEGDPNGPQQQTTNYQQHPQHPAAAAEAADEPGMYQGLLGVADEPQRVQRLANLLHWDRNLPADLGIPATLADCLRGVPVEGRLAVITAYWRARERAARYQALNEQSEQLGLLPPIVLTFRDTPGMAEAGVRLQAARRAASAAVLDAHLALVISQFNLTLAAGRQITDSWLVPGTAPQSGRYLVGSGQTGDSRAKRWAEAVHVQHAMLEDRADAIIQADAHRAAVVSEARRGAQVPAATDPADADELTALDAAMWAVERQNEETLAFLGALTQYNIAIANFALIKFPPGISSEELVKKLVIARSTRRDT